MKRILNYHGIDYYDVNDLLQLHPTQSYICERKNIASKLFTFHGKKYATQETIEDICMQIDLAENYYSKFNVETIFNCQGEYEDVLSPVLSKILDPKRYNGELYFKKSDIDKYHSLSELYSEYAGRNVVTAKELVRYHNSTRMYYMGNLYISQKHLDFLYKKSEQIFVNGQVCIEYKINALNDFEKRCCCSNEITCFDIYFDGRYNFPITMKLMKDYYRGVINKSTASNRQRTATSHIHMIDVFFAQLTKEIIYYTYEEIINNIFCNPLLITNKMIIGFLGYVKKKDDNFIPEIEELYLRSNNSSKFDSRQIYTPEQFAAIYDECLNINRHVENAYNDHAYAQYWLYIMLQLSNFIRSEDILNLPIFDLAKEYEWGYFCDHKMSEAEAHNICNICEIKAKNILIGKTQEKKRVYITTEMYIPLAISIVICNGHAKKRKLKSMFSCSKSISGNRIYQKMGEPFFQISNHKMNYSLATYFEQTGNEAEEYRSQVYTYLSYMRGHQINNPLAVSNTTMIYIKAANHDQNISNMSYHATQRGAFGWLYHLLLDYANERFDSLDEETRRIRELQKRYSPDDMEKLSEFVINNLDERMRVLNQLRQPSRENIQLFLSQIGMPGTFKTIQDLPCIMGRFCTKTGNACVYCEFSIKTVNALRIYKKELYNIIEKLSNEKYDNNIKKYMYLAYKILIVLKDVRSEFGAEYLSSYIDMEDIKDRMNLLPEKHTLLLKEVLSGDSKCKEKGNNQRY